MKCLVFNPENIEKHVLLRQQMGPSVAEGKIPKTTLAAIPGKYAVFVQFVHFFV